MTHVAFLRAVNVGGKGLVKMADLQKAFTAAGAKNVRTVIASGNVIFDAPASLGPIRDRILKKVGALLGAEPVIVFRTLPYLERLIEAAPFGAMANDKTVKLYVLFLSGKPKALPAFPITIPKEAVHREQGKTGVYVLEGDHLKWVVITQGVNNTTRTQVHELKENDAVALPSEKPLKDGAVVEPILP